MGIEKLYIEQYVPEKPKPYIAISDNSWASKFIYDKNTHIGYYLFTEPEWVHIEPDKLYEFRFVYRDGDSNAYHMRLYRRIDDHTVIIAEDYGEGFIKSEEDHLGKAWIKVNDIDSWINEYISDWLRNVLK